MILRDPSSLLAAIAGFKWIDRLRALKTAPAEALAEDIAVSDHGDAVLSAWSFERLRRGLKPAQSGVIRLVKLQGFSIEEAPDRTGPVYLAGEGEHPSGPRAVDLHRRQPDAE